MSRRVVGKKLHLSRTRDHENDERASLNGAGGAERKSGTISHKQRSHHASIKIDAGLLHKLGLLSGENEAC